MKTKNLIKKIVVGGLVLASLVGCAKKDDFVKRGFFRGYNAIASVDGAGRYLNLNEGKGIKGPSIIAHDLDKDKRFDVIKLRNMPKDHGLEKYANLDSLETAYNYVLNPPHVIHSFGGAEILVIPKGERGFDFYRDQNNDGYADTYGNGFYMIGLSRIFEEKDLPCSTYSMQNLKAKYDVIEENETE